VTAAGLAEHDVDELALAPSKSSVENGRRRRDKPVRVGLSSNSRSFLNSLSLGIYGDAVQRSAYRDAKLRTMLDTLHEVLSATDPPPELLVTDDTAHQHTSPLVVLVSNNAYALDQPQVAGSRPRLDTGRLGVVILDRPGAGAPPRFLRGPRRQSRSRAPRRCRRGSTARPSPYTRRSGA
jgi:diacylglycerol kinase family enzyme